MFYAYAKDPNYGRHCYLRKVELQKITANVDTKLFAANAAIKDMAYKDFSAQFNADTRQSISLALAHEVASKITLRNGKRIQFKEPVKQQLKQNKSSSNSDSGWCVIC